MLTIMLSWLITGKYGVRYNRSLRGLSFPRHAHHPCSLQASLRRHLPCFSLGRHIRVGAPQSVEPRHRLNGLTGTSKVSSYLKMRLEMILQVSDEDPNCEYLCLSHNPYADVIAVGTQAGNIKLYDEKTMQVSENGLDICRSTSRINQIYQFRSLRYSRRA